MAAPHFAQAVIEESSGNVVNPGDYGNSAVRVNVVAGGGGGGGAVTIADGADVALGALADAAITTNAAGTVSGKLRGLVSIFSNVWDSVNGRLIVDGSEVTQPVSGTVAVSNFPALQPVSGTVTANQGGAPWTVRPDGTVWALVGTAASVNISNATLAVTQSGVWSTGRTWTLSSGTDSVAAVQSGSWTVQQGGAPWAENITQLAGTGVAVGSGVVTAGTLRTTLATDVGLPTDTTSAQGSTHSASGDNTVLTPGVGNRIRLNYISLSADGGNSADVTVIVKFASGGGTNYKVSLKAGSIWARNVGAGRRYLDGGTNNALIINLSAAQTVHCSIEYDETI